MLLGSCASILGRCFTSCRAEGKSDQGGRSAAGPRAQVDLDPFKIRSVASGRLYQGKSAIHIARVYGERQRKFAGRSFWARGFFVSTVGRDEAVIREYIKNQEAEANLH